MKNKQMADGNATNQKSTRTRTVNTSKQEVLDFVLAHNTRLETMLGLQKKRFSIRPKGDTWYVDQLKELGVNTDRLNAFQKRLAVEQAKGLEQLRKMRAGLPASDFPLRVRHLEAQTQSIPGTGYVGSHAFAILSSKELIDKVAKGDVGTIERPYSGDSGEIDFADMRALSSKAVGSGDGWCNPFASSCSDEQGVACVAYFELTFTPTVTTYYRITPRVLCCGSYLLCCDDGVFTSKKVNGDVEFNFWVVQPQVPQPYGFYSAFLGDDLWYKEDDNIAETGPINIDYTAPEQSVLLAALYPATIKIYVDLYTYARGDGAVAELDFDQRGQGIWGWITVLSGP